MLNFPKFSYLILITYIVKLKITLFKRLSKIIKINDNYLQRLSNLEASFNERHLLY